jgi:hypothetical protein
MKIVTWNLGDRHTFVVLFANGTSGAEYVALNPDTGKHFDWNKRQATAAGERFRTFKGDNWENGNIEYSKFDPDDGTKTKLFERRNFTG